MALRADDVDLGRDHDLVARYQAGDPSAFDELYRRYFDRLRRFCSRHTSDRHEAEEVAQEAFARALTAMDTLEGERRFYPWMTVIARRISIDRHRKLGRLEPTDEIDLGTVEPDVEHLFRAVDAGHVRDAMGRVGPRHREVLLLREAEGLSYADIAQHLDVPVTTVEALLHRARKALRREYAAVGGETRGLWGLPLFGWLSTKVASIRSKVADHWVEIGAVAAPIAVGAATAAVVLVPSPDAGIRDRGSELALATTTTADDDELGSDAGSGLLDLVLPPTTAAAATTAVPTTPPAPAASAGPVDVFTGPEGTDRARGEAQRMPRGGTAGPATGGVDDTVAREHTEAFVDDVVDIVLGRTPAPDRPAPDPSAGSLHDLLGGTP